MRRGNLGAGKGKSSLSLADCKYAVLVPEPEKHAWSVVNLQTGKVVLKAHSYEWVLVVAEKLNLVHKDYQPKSRKDYLAMLERKETA